LDETDIRKLFTGVLEDPRQDTDDARHVFSILVKTTLRYRDEMLSSRGIAVTVEDVRTSLNWLVPVLATGEMPETKNKTSLGLLKIWLDELSSQ
jgi:hypothetical protein